MGHLYHIPSVHIEDCRIFGGKMIRPVFRKLVMYNFASSIQQGDAALLEFGSCMKCGESDFPSKIGKGLA